MDYGYKNTHGVLRYLRQDTRVIFTEGCYCDVTEDDEALTATSAPATTLRK